jgi:hypothetical protein
MVLPYLKGFLIIKCGFLYYWILVSICGDYFVFISLVLNKWYQSTFLGKKCGQFFFYFCRFFRRRKRGTRNYGQFMYIYVQNLQKWVVDLSSSQKNTQFKKKNRLKRSPGKSRYRHFKICKFSGFFPRTTMHDFFISVAPGGRIC